MRSVRGRCITRAGAGLLPLLALLLQTRLTDAQNFNEKCVYDISDISNNVNSNLKYCGYEYFCHSSNLCGFCYSQSVNNNTCYLPMNNCSQVDGRCSHSDILYSLDDFNFKYILGASVITFFVGVLASGSGLGGGAVIIPILVIICSFQAPQAAPVSKAYLLGCSVVNIAHYLKQRHPLAPARPLIDYHLACMLLPLQLIGSQVGVLFNSFLPAYVLVAGIAVTLGYAIWKMSQKFRQSLRKDRLSSLKLSLSTSTSGSQSTPLVTVRITPEQRHSSSQEYHDFQ